MIVPDERYCIYNDIIVAFLEYETEILDYTYHLRGYCNDKQ